MQHFFSKKNYLGLLIGALMLVIGFFLLGLKPADNKLALNVAPFILILAFMVVIPISIFLGTENEGKK